MRQTRYLLVIGVTALVLISAVGPAVAHDTQAVAGNEVTFGGADEPLVTGERMWLEFEIVDAESGGPVENVSENLTVSIQMEGHEKTALESSDKYGEPGVYEAPVVFTEAGDYVVHLEGTIDGKAVHTHFEKTVDDRAALEYPGDDAQSSAGSDESQSDGNETQSASFASATTTAVAVGIVGIAAAGVMILRRRR
nr:FixH family protein [Natrinema altunense]